MKISPRSSALALTATALLAISACGSSDSSSEAAPRTKNAAFVTVAPRPTTTLNPDATPTTTPTDAPTTTVDLAVNTASVCGTVQTNTQKAAAIIEKQLLSQGIEQTAAQSASSAAAAAIERARILNKDDCAPATTAVPTTTSTTLAPTTTTTSTIAPTTTTITPNTTAAPSTTRTTVCTSLMRRLRMC